MSSGRGRKTFANWAGIKGQKACTEHPNWLANYGAWYVDQVLKPLTSNPELWSKTAIYIAYDEIDGFFGHVVPPHAPQSRQQGASTVDSANEFFAGDASNAAGPYGLGPRVPMLVVSPDGYVVQLAPCLVSRGNSAGQQCVGAQ